MDPKHPESAIRLSDAEEELCRRYGRARFLLNVAEFCVPLGMLVLLTFSGGARSLLTLSHPTGLSVWIGDLEFLVLIGFLVRLALLPLQFAGEHWLDRRFGLSHQSLASWAWEWLCRSIVFGFGTVLLLFPVMESLRWIPVLIVLWCAVFVFGRRLFFDCVYYPLIACFYPVRFLRNETFALPGVGKITLPVYQVRVSHNTRRANAGIRLRGKKTAIYVTDTLIDEFTDGEERVVMAHEFGHLYDHLHLEERTRAGVAQAHRKLRLGSVQLLAGLVSLLIMHLLAPTLGLQGVHDLAGFPLLAALTLGLGQLLSPLLCAEARRDERDADEYALAVTGDVGNYISVMRKLRRMNLEESCSGPLCRLLFDTHPSYTERVRLAMEYRRRHHRHKAPHWRGWRNVQRTGRR
jgi:STE24 endopeptidase